VKLTLILFLAVTTFAAIIGMVTEPRSCAGCTAFNYRISLGTTIDPATVGEPHIIPGSLEQYTRDV